MKAKQLNAKLIPLDDFGGIDPPAHKINSDYVQQPGNSRKCIQCDKWHDTIVENTMTGERLEECEKCRDCIMNGCFFNPIKDQIVLHD